MYKKPPFSEAFKPSGRPRSPQMACRYRRNVRRSAHGVSKQSPPWVHAKMQCPLFESNKESNKINNLEVLLIEDVNSALNRRNPPQCSPHVLVDPTQVYIQGHGTPCTLHVAHRTSLVPTQCVPWDQF